MVTDVDGGGNPNGMEFPNGEEEACGPPPFPKGELLLVFMDPLLPKGDWVGALPKDVDPLAAGTSCEKLHRLPLLHLPCKKKVHNLLPLLSVTGCSVLLLLLETPIFALLLLLFQGDGKVPELPIAWSGMVVGAIVRNGEDDLGLLLLSCEDAP
jgi:hypothetical protein